MLTASPRGNTRTIVAAVVQAEVPRDPSAAIDRTVALAREAADEGAQLIAFPETWIPGYPIWLDVCRDAGLWDHAPVKRVYARMAEHSVEVPGPATAAIAGVARELGATIVIGVSERVAGGPGRGTLYNTLLTFDATGELVNHHRKLMPTYTERLVWGAGDAAGLRSAETAVGRVGGLVCWEHWMPLARQALHDSGEDVHVAVWPTVHELHQVASRHYAFEGRCFVLAAGALMRDDALPPELEPHPAAVSARNGWVMRGGSAIIGPDGAYIVPPVYESPAILTAELHVDRIREESMTLDVTGHYHRPELFDFAVRRSFRAKVQEPERTT